jgi:hypothetical protein
MFQDIKNRVVSVMDSLVNDLGFLKFVADQRLKECGVDEIIIKTASYTITVISEKAFAERFGNGEDIISRFTIIEHEVPTSVKQ